jgi:hypothetical protein
LRLAGDELWKEVTADNIVKFANLLREAQQLVWDNEIFFQDRDRQDLALVLKELSDFRLGKLRLLEIDSKSQIIRAEISGPSEFRSVSRYVENNRVAKLAYERTLENIRKSFHNKLSGKIE